MGMLGAIVVALPIASFFKIENLDFNEIVRLLSAFTSTIAILLAITVYLNNSLWRRDDKDLERSEFYFKESSELLSNAKMIIDMSEDKLDVTLINRLSEIILLLPKFRERMPQEFHKEVFDEKVNIIRDSMKNKIDKKGIYFLTGIELEIKDLKGDSKFLGLYSEVYANLITLYEKTNGDIVELNIFGRPSMFPSGLMRTHILVYLSFLSEMSIEQVTMRLDHKKYGRSKWLRRSNPILTSAYHFMKNAAPQNSTSVASE